METSCKSTTSAEKFKIYIDIGITKNKAFFNIRNIDKEKKKIRGGGRRACCIKEKGEARREKEVDREGERQREGGMQRERGRQRRRDEG